MLECEAALVSSYTPMGQVSAFGVTALSIDVLMKLFVGGLTFVFQLAQVTTSSSHDDTMPVAWGMSVVSFPGT